MVPDFSKTKSEISKLLSLRLRVKTTQLSVLASLARPIVQHEGTIHSYPQEGFGNISEGFEQFQVPIKLTVEEMKHLTGNKLAEKMDAMAEEMARKTSEHGYRVLDRVTAKAGNVLDAGGEAFSKDHYLSMLEKIEMSFKPDGQPDFVIVAHPQMAEALSRIWPVWEKDSDFMAQYNALLSRKREDWLDRESNRKLAD